jgi:hypothetical protein
MNLLNSFGHCKGNGNANNPLHIAEDNLRKNRSLKGRVKLRSCPSFREMGRTLIAFLKVGREGMEKFLCRFCAPK